MLIVVAYHLDRLYNRAGDSGGVHIGADNVLLSGPDTARTGRKCGNASGGLDGLNHQFLITRIAVLEVVADLRAPADVAKIMDCLGKLYDRPGKYNRREA